MKALEILKNDLIFAWEYVPMKGMLRKDINEAIAELEAMQNANSCEGCVDFKNNVCTDINWCSRDKRLTDNYKLKVI